MYKSSQKLIGVNIAILKVSGQGDIIVINQLIAIISP